MKKFKIGELEVSMCENLEDMHMNRWVAFKAQMNQSETGREIPSSIALYQDMMNTFNKEDQAGLIVRLYKEIIELKHVQEMDDADQLMFALMTLEEGENPSKTDKNLLKEKLQRFGEHNLSQGTIQKEVSNFISGLVNS